MAGNFLGNNFINVRIDPFKSANFPMGDRNSSSSIIDFPSNGDILMFNGTDTTAPEGYWCNTNYALAVSSRTFEDASAAVANAINNAITNEVSQQFSNTTLQSNESNKIQTIDGKPNFILDASNIKVEKLRGTGISNFGEAILTIGHHQYIEGQEGLIQFPSLKHNGMFKFEHNDDVGNARINFKYESSSADTSARNMMTWNGNGCVGINDDTPSVPLEVKHPHPNTFYWNRHDWGHYFNVFGKSAAGYTHSANYAIVAMFHGSIASNAFHAQSDERIKCDFEDVSDNEALDIVNKIDCVKYNYKDPLEKRNKKTIGFIAQQVEEHLPNVINKMTRFIPDVLQNVTCDASGFVDYMVDMSDNHTGKCRFYVESMDLEDMSKGILPIDVEYNNGCKLPKHYENVFFWGREVTDFHTLDKNQIFALHHSAIQEMDRKYKTLLDKYNTLKNEVDVIKSHLTT